MEKRFTPDFITELKENEIFVFGSNLHGWHDGGAAYVAEAKFGAIYGQGVGLQGQSYAIPTMQGGVETIKPYVDEFIKFAKEHKELIFYVTKIGCGIAGFTEDEIAPLFADAIDVENIILPETFYNIIITNDFKNIGEKITNKEFIEMLKQYPEDALVVVEYCNPRFMSYDKENNLIKID